MSTLEKRGVFWRVKIRRKGFPIQTRSFDTKAQAQRWARDIESEMDRGLFFDHSEAEKNTLGDAIARYLREVTPLKKGAGPESSRLNALMAKPLAQIKMAALSSQHIAIYRDQRLKQVAPATVCKELNHIGHVIETARREWGIQLAENPVRMVRRPSSPKARDRRIEDDEEQRLFQSCDDARNSFLRPIVGLAIETGMRQGELVALQWKHIDLKKCTAFLPETKNGESRAIPLSSTATNILRALPRSMDGKVFSGVSAEAVKRAFIRACRRAEIDNLHFHDLRHEATSRLFEKGLNLMEVATVTGHKTLQMLKRYTHLRASDLARKLG